MFQTIRPVEPLLELYQAEWCPSSRRVRQRLTELGISFVAHQVPPERSERSGLRWRTGVESIPTAVLDDGTVVVGAEAILASLNNAFADTPSAEAHRHQAERFRCRELEGDDQWAVSATR